MTAQQYQRWRDNTYPRLRFHPPHFQQAQHLSPTPAQQSVSSDYSAPNNPDLSIYIYIYICMYVCIRVRGKDVLIKGSR
jgi:hypothetical protein